MINNKFSPWPSFTNEEIESVKNVLSSNKVNYWTGSETKLFEKEITFKVEFPFTVTVDIAKKLVKKDDKNGPPFGMYV